MFYNMKIKMKKISLIRIYTLLVIFLWLGAIASASTMLNFIWINMWSIDQKFSEVAFKARWNDFMGAIFWLNAKSIETWEVIKVGGGIKEKTCFKKVRWIYYNAQRWNRLRPLDEDTLAYFTWTSATYNNLSMSGWLYTSCSGEEYSIYGQVTYHVGWDSYDSHITAWVQYDRTANAYSWSFARSLQRFDNKYPIGYIYDDRWGGIWFVWGLWNANDYSLVIAKLNQWSWINNLFWYQGTNNDIYSTVLWTSITVSSSKWNAINTLMNAWVRWTVWLSFSVNTVEKNTILWNFEKKTLIFNALNINFSKLINEVRKSTENLCKWKYEWADEYDSNYFSNKKIICLDFSWDSNNYITIDQSDWTNLKNKTIVIKNWDVRIAQWMWIEQGPVNLFIDKWNLLVANNTWSIIWFDGNWYPTNAWVTKWINLKWNFIINGLIIWAKNNGMWRTKEAFKHKLFFNWKLASLNTPSYPSQWRIDQITSIFNTWANNIWIWLGNVFKRECNPIDWDWSDNGFTPCDGTWDRNALLPLIIVDGNYKFF
jgi:hypothetical protein